MKKLKSQGHTDRVEESIYLQYVRDDVFLTLFEENVFIKGGVSLHNLRQHLRHFCLREQTAWKTNTDKINISNTNTSVSTIDGMLTTIRL